MNSSVTLVIFEGGLVGSELEKTVQQVRQAIVLDLIAKAQSAGFARIILCTSYMELATAAKHYDIEIEYQPSETEEFHFGERLLQTINNNQLTKVLYMGGASAPLISVSELNYIRQILADHDRVITANNYYSADLVGVSPANILSEIDLPPVDNALPNAICQQTDLRYIPLQRSLGLQFDLDTPGDLLVLAIHPEVGRLTKKALDKANLDTSRCKQIREIMNDPMTDLVVFGRVGSPLFKQLDEFTRCRIRLYSEERGLKSLGRDVRGEAVSLVGELIAAIGYEGFFAFLPQICSGAVLDTRIFFAHFKWDLTQSDRFYSDLGLVEKIEHLELRKFTQAATQATIPIMLGGHSLVTGGLLALIEASYLTREQ